jgi:hypothetical protein
MLTHLYELVQQRAAAHPTATAVGGQEGLRWQTLDSRQLLDLVDRLAVDLAASAFISRSKGTTMAPSLQRAKR